ncbi:polysaccharide deacetylase family protein [Alphaproteobacteria bacterium]|nr:polysaccharide deacetylase family protein [Alphaproteobacteria bacterium]
MKNILYRQNLQVGLRQILSVGLGKILQTGFLLGALTGAASGITGAGIAGVGIFGGILTGFAASAHAADHTADHAVILMYHRFGENDYPTTNVRLEQFDDHLEVLANGDYNVWALEDIVDHFQKGLPLPDRTVAITIDDAYLSVYEEAFPRLQKYNFTATVFVATRPVDQGLRRYMSWDQLREMQAAGFDIGSQTQTHPHMHRLSDDENRAELEISNKRFLAELGLRPNLFAYPYGEYDLDVIKITKEAGFIAAFGQNSGVAHGYNGFFELPRFAMNEQYGNRDRLELAINALPLKVKQIVPEDVVLTENPPVYGFTLADDMDQERQLRCFNNRFGKLDVSIIGRRAEIRMPGPLTGKRARVNCTMPGPNGRWRWFGRQFLTE